MNTWQALKKIVRNQFTRPVPEPWNGKHELTHCKYVEHAAWPDDFWTGWVWRCSCGTNKSEHASGVLGSLRSQSTGRVQSTPSIEGKH